MSASPERSERQQECVDVKLSNVPRGCLNHPVEPPVDVFIGDREGKLAMVSPDGNECWIYFGNAEAEWFGWDEILADNPELMMVFPAMPEEEPAQEQQTTHASRRLIAIGGGIAALILSLVLARGCMKDARETERAPDTTTKKTTVL